jgi:hypothetical protein
VQPVLGRDLSLDPAKASLGAGDHVYAATTELFNGKGGRLAHDPSRWTRMAYAPDKVNLSVLFCTSMTTKLILLVSVIGNFPDKVNLPVPIQHAIPWKSNDCYFLKQSVLVQGLVVLS